MNHFFPLSKCRPKFRRLPPICHPHFPNSRRLPLIGQRHFPNFRRLPLISQPHFPDFQRLLLISQPHFPNSRRLLLIGHPHFPNLGNLSPRGQRSFPNLGTHFSTPKVLNNLNLLTQPTQKRTGHNLSPIAISIFRHMSGCIPVRFRDAGWQSYPKAINRGVPQHFPKNRWPWRATDVY